MCSTLLLMLMVFISTPLSFAQTSDEAPLVIGNIISEEPIRVRLPELRMRETGRQWSAEELEESQISSSYQTWLSCYNNPSDPTCGRCEQDTPEVVYLSNELRDRCLPARSDKAIAFSPFLTPEQRTERDRMICDCYQSGRAGPMGDFAFSASPAQAAANMSEDERRARALIDATRLDTARGRLRQETMDRFVTERFQTSFSAASFVRDLDGSLQLGGNYNFTAETITGARARSAQPRFWAGHNASGGRSSEIASEDLSIMNQAIQEANRRDLTANDLTSTSLLETGNYCIPYRNFLASKQFPDDPDFYAALDDQDSNSWQDWNYGKLSQKLQSLAQRAGGLEAAIGTPGSEGSRIFSRMRFLRNNPVILNILQANGNFRQTKHSLMELLQGMPRLNCTASGCQRTAAWNQQVREYQDRMATFLNDPPVIQAAAAGAVDSRVLHSQIAQARAFQEVEPSETFLGENFTTSNAGAWRTYCDYRTQMGRVTEKTGSEFLLAVEDAVGERNFESPEKDEEYRQLNTHVCGMARRGRTGDMTFAQFLQTSCGSSPTSPECTIEGRPQLVARFLNLYPDSAVDSDRKEVEALRPFLGGDVAPGRLAQTSINSGLRQYNSVSSIPVRARRAVSFDGPDAPAASVSRLATTTPVPSSGTGSAPSASSSGARTDSPVFFPAPILPASDLAAAPNPLRPTPAPVPASVLRERLSENENDVQGIRDQISGLRDVLQDNRRGQGNLGSSEVNELTQRLASMERRLADKETESRQLQDQLDRIERPVARAQLAPLPESSVNGPRRGLASASVAPVVPQGGVSGGSLAASLPGPIGGTSSGVESASGERTPENIRPSRGSGARRFGVEQTTLQNGITVAVSSGNINFPLLWRQSEESVIPVTVSAEDFNRILANDQSVLAQFFPQAQALPGEVVRLSVRTEGQQALDVFLVKEGGELLLVNSPVRTRIQDALDRAPAGSVVRDYTLNNLRNEFGGK